MLPRLENKLLTRLQLRLILFQRAATNEIQVQTVRMFTQPEACSSEEFWYHNQTKHKRGSSAVNSSYLFIKIQNLTFNLHDLFMVWRDQEWIIDCHRSELRIFLLFFQSLSSWTTETCRDAVEHLFDVERCELKSFAPEKQEKTHLEVWVTLKVWWR